MVLNDITHQLEGKVVAFQDFKKEIELPILIDPSIKIYVIGYVNGVKLGSWRPFMQGQKIDPKAWRWGTITDSNKTVKLAYIATSIVSNYRCTIESDSSHKYTIFDTTDIKVKKALKFDVSFNYRIKDDEDSLRKILEIAGGIDMMKNFLNNHNKFETKRKDIKDIIMKAVSHVADIETSIPKLEKVIRNSLNDESTIDKKLIGHLDDCGIAIESIDIRISDMGEALLTMAEKSENAAKREVAMAVSERIRISTVGETKRHQNDQDAQTLLEQEQHESQRQGEINRRAIDTANAEREIEGIKDATIRAKTLGLSVPQYLMLYRPEDYTKLLHAYISKPASHSPGPLYDSQNGTYSELASLLLGEDLTSRTSQVFLPKEEEGKDPEQKPVLKNVD